MKFLKLFEFPMPSACTLPKRRPAVLVCLLGALAAVVPLGIDMYVPGFPGMVHSLHASDVAIQLSMTAFLAGLVVGQLFFGPLSDGLGRRCLLLWGTASFSVLSAVCALAPTVQVLIATRFVQGMAGAVGAVLARAVVTDWFHGRGLPRYFSVLSMIVGVAPITAPLAGGAILSVSGWRTIFLVLSAVGLLLFLAVVTSVAESLPPTRRQPGGVINTFRAMGRLLCYRPFVGYMLTLGLCGASLFTYIAGSSFVFQNSYGLSASQYSLFFMVNAVDMLLASAVFGVLSRRVRLNYLLAGSVGVATAGATAQVLLLSTIGSSLSGAWICLLITLTGVGAMSQAAMSLGQTIARSSSGAASALLGGAELLFGAAASPAAGFFGSASSISMGIIMLVAIAMCVVVLFALVRPWERHGESDVSSEPTAVVA
ncbi:multidrug effflux MFS transporter [Streptomyces sp. NPDC057686]|uniref:multidrug effflux MFS transporter n=1 Tax=Streptomyces sp. NPDC057686 TaxID=3346212 RepID=UPI0036C940DE